MSTAFRVKCFAQATGIGISEKRDFEVIQLVNKCRLRIENSGHKL